MARNRTAGELTGSVRRRGHYEADLGDTADAFIGDDVMLDFLDSALAEFWDLKVTLDPDRHLTLHTFTTSTGTGSYALPSDLFRLRAVDREAVPSGSGDWTPLDPVGLSERDVLGTSDGRPEAYRLQGDQVVLSPTPDGSYGVSLLYIPAAARVTSSLQTVDGIDGHEELPVLYTLRRCQVRARESTVEVDQEIARQEARVRRGAGRRDRGGPRVLEDPALVRTRSWRRR